MTQPNALNVVIDLNEMAERNGFVTKLSTDGYLGIFSNKDPYAKDVRLAAVSTLEEGICWFVGYEQAKFELQNTKG